VSEQNSNAPGRQGPARCPPICIRQFAAAEWQVYRRLRLASLADAPDAFGSTLAAEHDRPDAHWKQRLHDGIDSANDQPLLALAGNEPAGLVWGRIEPASPSVAHVYQMWVAPAHRRQGIGADLLVALIAWAGSRNAVEVVLSVACGDSQARRLYQRIGFEPAGEPMPLRRGSTLQAQSMRRRIS
jgi:ribosomal protein S18 acetylase RimI-like enzyme